MRITKNNYIGHNTDGTSDKVYIVTMQIVNGTYNVVAHYGRRGKRPKKVVKVTNGSEWAAKDAMEKLIREKFEKGGYVDIDNPNYRGSVTRSTVGPYLVREGATEVPKPTPVTPAPKPPVKIKVSEMFCVNNAGLEDKFEEGKAYKFVREVDEDFIELVDMNGLKQECFKERFSEAVTA